MVTRGLDEDGFADIQTVKVVHVRERKSETARQNIGEYEDSGTEGLKSILIDHS